MINRDKMIETFEEMYGLPNGDLLDRSTWENWMGIWSVAWRHAEEALLQTIAAEQGLSDYERTNLAEHTRAANS